MKWKRKGGKLRAQVAGCLFVVSQTPDWWEGRFCNPSGQWSESTIWDEKKDAIRWCELQAELEISTQAVEEIRLNNRKQRAEAFANMPGEVRRWIKIFRTWKQLNELERREIEKEFPHIIPWMQQLNDIETNTGNTL